MQMIFLKLLIIFNFLYIGKSSSFVSNNDDCSEEEASGVDSNLMIAREPLNRVSTYEQNVFAMAEKIKSLTDTFDQLELKINSSVDVNMHSLEKNIRKIMEEIIEDKISKIDEKFREKLTCKTWFDDWKKWFMKSIFYFEHLHLRFTTKQIDTNKISYNVHEVKCLDNRLPANCYEINECRGNIYNIKIPELSDNPFPAVCELKTADGGWIVIQRRQNGLENFYRDWADYVEGFGNMNGEFFIGLEKLHALTSLGEPQELYIILEDFEGERRYARYGEFKVGSKNTEYELTVREYSGDAGDCLFQHNGTKFTTKDRDNDKSPDNCAIRWKGAWWYTSCFHSNLNGLYLAGKTPKSKDGISWCGFRKYGYSLKFVQMMIRPKTD